MSVDTFTSWVNQYNAGFYYKQLLSNGITDPKLIELLDYAVAPIKDNPFLCVLKQGTLLYRARIIKSDEFKEEYGICIDASNHIHGFDRMNSAEAPLGRPGEGRNNIKGVSYLYLAENAQTACAEVKANNGEIISVARFMPRRDLNLINFAEDVKIPAEYSLRWQISLPVFFTRLMNAFRTPYSDEKGYQLTQAITDYVRKAGFDGIVYRSSLSDEICYTIFNSHHSIMEYIDSSPYLPVATTRKYLNINSGEACAVESGIPESKYKELLDRTRNSIRDVLENKK